MGRFLKGMKTPPSTVAVDDRARRARWVLQECRGGGGSRAGGVRPPASARRVTWAGGSQGSSGPGSSTGSGGCRWGDGGSFATWGSCPGRLRTTVQIRQVASPERTCATARAAPTWGVRSQVIPTHATTCKPVPGPRDRTRASSRARRWRGCRDMGQGLPAAMALNSSWRSWHITRTSSVLSGPAWAGVPATTGGSGAYSASRPMALA